MSDCYKIDYIFHEKISISTTTHPKWQHLIRPNKNKNISIITVDTCYTHSRVILGPKLPVNDTNVIMAPVEGEKTDNQGHAGCSVDETVIRLKVPAEEQ